MCESKKVVEVLETDSEKRTNYLLSKGWLYLTARNEGDKSQVTIYVLGRPDGIEPEPDVQALAAEALRTFEANSKA